MKGLLLSTITLIAFSFGSNAQNVNIPDANFKAYLVGNTSINTNADTEIQVSEASVFTGTINCVSMGISDLTGIEAFTSLTRLNCNINSLTTIDVTQNTALTYISCAANSILTLDVSQCPSVDSLYCYSNSLTSLDVSQNSALSEFLCFQNQLTTLDLSQNPNIYRLWCANNQLTFLNLANGNNTNLGDLAVHNNSNLGCIQVDDVAYSTANWINIGMVVSFSTNCSVGITDLKPIKTGIYPNPTSAQIRIETEGKVEQVSVYSMCGYKVKTEYSKSFSVENLPAGVYIVNIRTNDGIFRSRFIKE